ncbi:class I SAM-dependent methyltransferase [Grimontia kaedaensis]|uniref:Class I SAM-dependent methyltransferase n=1 Tax=Grimontia kaedaensis TaxID=2872157 RepID=A0ABY4WNX0_9GAMM|nr:class I SAM-dependent methyltransferase [Grimontia kaedaensis]USH01277.1 class I SAM-dependent methyltransferase [Grimontia kaedaensis]
MNPEQIGKAYDQITHLWTDEGFNMTNGITQHKKAMSFAKHRGKALDIGCGCTGRFMDLLMSEGFTPSGLDVSGEMLKIAREKHPNVRFIQGDICEYLLSEKYDFITAWDSIWHIPLSEQKQVLTKIVESLNEGGVFIFSFGGTEESGAHKDDFMGPEVYYSSLGTNGFLNLFIELGCIIRHLEYDQYPELHTYLIVQKT